MTPLEWAEVFEAGQQAIAGPATKADPLELALYAMREKALEIHARHAADEDDSDADAER